MGSSYLGDDERGEYCTTCYGRPSDVSKEAHDAVCAELAALKTRAAPPATTAGAVDEIVREIDALAEKATKGPWFEYHGCAAVERIDPENGPFPEGPLLQGNKPDLALAIALVNAWPQIKAALSARTQKDRRP